MFHAHILDELRWYSLLTLPELDDDPGADTTPQYFESSLLASLSQFRSRTPRQTSSPNLAQTSSSFDQSSSSRLSSLTHIAILQGFRLLTPDEFVPFAVPAVLNGLTKANPVALDAKYAAAISVHAHESHSLFSSLQAQVVPVPPDPTHIPTERTRGWGERGASSRD